MSQVRAELLVDARTCLPKEATVSVVQVIGVDPGLVHTGVVELVFGIHSQNLLVKHGVVDGPDAAAVTRWVQQPRPTKPVVFVEAYRPRQHLSTDQRMLQAEHELRQGLGDATFLPNMGIKRIITRDLMELVDVWDFPTSTHHQDLRAAARIALLGMVKDTVMNGVLADVVGDHLGGQPWRVTHV